MPSLGFEYDPFCLLRCIKGCEQQRTPFCPLTLYAKPNAEPVCALSEGWLEEGLVVLWNLILHRYEFALAQHFLLNYSEQREKSELHVWQVAYSSCFILSLKRRDEGEPWALIMVFLSLGFCLKASALRLP